MVLYFNFPSISVLNISVWKAACGCGLSKSKLGSDSDQISAPNGAATAGPVLELSTFTLKFQRTPISHLQFDYPCQWVSGSVGQSVIHSFRFGNSYCISELVIWPPPYIICERTLNRQRFGSNLSKCTKNWILFCRGQCKIWPQYIFFICSLYILWGGMGATYI